MFSRSPRQPSNHPDQKAERDAARAFERVRDHWSTCASCRNAASASSSLWCAQGLELMRRGIAEHPHWDSCESCREAQARVRAVQCELGRTLEEEYRVLVRRLAGA